MSEPIPTPRTSTLFKSLPLESPVDWMNGMNKMAKHGYALETECTRMQTALEGLAQCFDKEIRQLTDDNFAGPDFNAYKAARKLLTELDSQQKQP